MSKDKFKSSDIASYLYSRLPQVYREEDKEQLLKRFIDIFSEEGLAPLMNDTANIMDLLDVDKCPVEYLPYLCSYYGYNYSLEIPELFQRRLLKHIVALYKRKGTKSVVNFIARELTGFDSEIIENKDFTSDQIEVTGWGKEFKNYRNFILRLTAPYETSSLYNKEDIIVKILDDFLPTNSKFLVITSYWFKEDSEIMKKSTESIYDLVREYNTEVFQNLIHETIPKEIIQESPFYYERSWYGDEESYLNYPFEGFTLVTNAIANLRDTVKFNMDSYSVKLFLTEADSNKAILSDPEEISNRKHSYEETFKYKDSVEEIHKEVNEPITQDTTKLSLDEEVNDTDKNKSVIYLNMKILQDLEDLYEIISGAQETLYDIINMVDNDNSNLTSQINTNVLLNRENGLSTNALFMWDKVKEQNKPDTIIIL